MARLRGCLEQLPDGAHRLLSLRAGLHGPARSAAATARILHLSGRREARLERQALTSLMRGGGCARRAVPVPATMVPATSALSPRPPAAETTQAVAAGPSASLSAAHAERSELPQHGVSPAPAASPHGLERAVTGSSFPAALLLLLLAVLLGLVALIRPDTFRGLLFGFSETAAGASADAGARAGAPPSRAPRLTGAVPRTVRARAVLPPKDVHRGSREVRMDDAMADMAADVFTAMSWRRGETVSGRAEEPDAQDPRTGADGDRAQAEPDEDGEDHQP